MLFLNAIKFEHKQITHSLIPEVKFYILIFSNRGVSCSSSSEDEDRNKSNLKKQQEIYAREETHDDIPWSKMGIKDVLPYAVSSSLIGESLHGQHVNKKEYISSQGNLKRKLVASKRSKQTQRPKRRNTKGELKVKEKNVPLLDLENSVEEDVALRDIEHNSDECSPNFGLQQWKVTGEVMVVCKFCGKQKNAKYVTQMREHVNIQHVSWDNKKKLVCEHCGQVSLSKASLHYHRMQKHSTNVHNAATKRG